MAEDEPTKGGKSDHRIQVSMKSMSDLAASIFEDCLHNIIHDVVLGVHRSEKLARMTSAAVNATESAYLSASNTSQDTTSTPQTATKPSTSHLGPPPQITVETPAAVYTNGVVTLKSNPFKTTSSILCPRCKLPRLLHPLSGKGAKPPEDLNRNYCTYHPFISKPGHDIYGNPFPVDLSNKPKKERELLKKQEKESMRRDDTPNSQDTNETGEVGPSSGGISRLMAGGKPASYVPWHTCPNCKRSLLITKFAQHLEKCLGIGGRQSSRNANARIAGQNGSQNGTGAGNTPLGSRVGTPAPAKKDDDDDEEEKPKIKKKKSSYIKKADREREKIMLKIKPPSASGTNSPTPAKRLPKSSEEGKDEKTDSGKRERAKDGDEEGNPRKKIKLIKETSVVSEAATNGADSADELE